MMHSWMEIYSHFIFSSQSNDVNGYVFLLQIIILTT
jgi:hypothetical protein